MRTHVFGAALLLGTIAAGAALAGPSAAVFANADGSLAGNVVLHLSNARGSLDLQPFATGNVDETGALNPNFYLAGLCGSSDGCLGNDLVSRDFFQFDTTGLPGAATAATLMLYNPDATVLPFSGLPVAPGYISATPTLNFAVYSASGLIFGALGAGPVLGSATVASASDGSFVDIALNAQALAAINAGGTLTLGGAVVPEPAALSVIALGLLGLGSLRRRAN